MSLCWKLNLGYDLKLRFNVENVSQILKVEICTLGENARLTFGNDHLVKAAHEDKDLLWLPWVIKPTSLKQAFKMF